MLKENIKEVFTEDFLFDYQLVHVNLQQVVHLFLYASMQYLLAFGWSVWLACACVS